MMVAAEQLADKRRVTETAPGKVTESPLAVA